jgi:glycine/D-amino acid oxidase-like deaminating enzyme
LLRRAVELLPQLEGAALTHIWSGLRPDSQDSYPILGRVAPWENVILATGHGAGGFELSAITGKAIAELILTGKTPTLIQPFGIDRFAGTVPVLATLGYPFTANDEFMNGYPK